MHPPPHSLSLLTKRWHRFRWWHRFLKIFTIPHASCSLTLKHMHPSTISRTERHALVGPHLPKAFSCTPVHGNIASSHESTVHSAHITYRGWSCRKTRVDSVHKCCRKLPRAPCCTEARVSIVLTQCPPASKCCCSPLAKAI